MASAKRPCLRRAKGLDKGKSEATPSPVQRKVALRGSSPGRPGMEKRCRMAWVLLIVAGLFEVVWAYCMKLSQGFTQPLPTAITIVTMIASFALLSVAMKSLPLGTAYMVWTGIGAVGAFIAGVAFLGETVSPMRIAAAALIVCGIVLMKLSSGGNAGA